VTSIQTAVSIWLGGGVLSYVYELAIVRYAPSHMTVNARRVHQDARDNVDPVVMFITLLLVAAACGPLWLFIDLWHDVPIMYRHWFPKKPPGPFPGPFCPHCLEYGGHGGEKLHWRDMDDEMGNRVTGCDSCAPREKSR